MPFLLWGAILSGGAFLGSIANNATAPSPINTPQDDIPYADSISKLAVPLAVAGAIYLGARKFLK